MKKFDHFRSNLNVLARAGEQDLENEFIAGGILNKFALQFELGWKVLKRLSEHEGMGEGLGSPREVIKTAYRYLDFMDEGVWLSMLRDRNAMTHIYDGAAARELVDRVIGAYVPEFQRMRDAVEERYGAELESL